MLARVLGKDCGLTDITAGLGLKKVIVLQDDLLSCDCFTSKLLQNSWKKACFTQMLESLYRSSLRKKKGNTKATDGSQEDRSKCLKKYNIF